MNTSLARAVIVATSGLLMLAQGALARPWKVDQPWTPRLASHQSRVQSCANPTPPDGVKVALDDWICTASGPIAAVKWCGVVLNPAQLSPNRRYHIAIWNHEPANCRPGTVRLYSACVIPSWKLIGTDCQNLKVYEFAASLPPPLFFQTAGQHYWLQVSEEDVTSATPGVDDFRWSGHRPLVNCPAAQRTNAFVVNQPLIDACDGGQDDLSFSLYSRPVYIVISHLPWPPTFGQPSARIEFWTPDGQTLVEVLDEGISDDGVISANPSAPDGPYQVVVRINGVLPLRAPVLLAEGVESRASFFDVFIGDLDNDGSIGLPDISPILFNWGRTAP